MSKAHQNSNINIAGTIIGIDNSVQAFFPFKDHANDVIYGIQPIVNSNTTLTEDGIAVAQSTTNYSSQPYLANTVDTIVGSSSLKKTTFFINGVWKSGLSFTQGLTTDIVSIDFPISQSSFTGGSSITFSFLAKTNLVYPLLKSQITCNVDGVANWYNGAWTTTPGTETSLLFSTMNEANVWKRFSYTLYLPAGVITNFTLGGFYRTTGNFQLSITEIQVEQKAFPTAFVDSSREDGALYYAFDEMVSSNHSISLEYKHPDLSGYPTNMVFMSSYDGSVAGAWFGITGGTNNIVMSSISTASQPKTWHKATITWDGTTSRFYLDGNLIGSEAIKWLFHTKYLSFSSMFGWASPVYLGSHIIKNLAIYNRAISDAETKQLHSSQLSYNSEEGACT